MTFRYAFAAFTVAAVVAPLAQAEPRILVLSEQDEAAYRDAANNLQAAFSRDETLMRMILMHDIGLRHLPAVAILTAVTWAP